MRLISIDLESKKGFFKNPQFNGEKESKHYSFDSIHKNALLGMFGSLIGLSGLSVYDNKIDLPEYYKKLSHLKVGISILNPIEKQWDKLNSSTGLYSGEPGGNLSLEYHNLNNPKYRIYILLDETIELEKILLEILEKDLEGYFGEIHFGKSSFVVKRTNFKNYEYKEIDEIDNEKIETIFEGEYDAMSQNKSALNFIFENTSEASIFERTVSIPYGLELLNKEVRYKEIKEYNFTNKKVELKSENLYKLDNGEIVQLF